MTDVRICFVGDSFTQGTGDNLCLGWPGRLAVRARARGHDLTIYNLGVRRETSADIKARWLAEVTPRLIPGVDGRVVFSFGANDATMEGDRWRVDPDESEANALEIIQEARSRWPVLVVGIPPAPEPDRTSRHAELAARYQFLCERLGVPFLDVMEPLIQSRAWWDEVEDGDGIHPGAGGYAALAAVVEAWPAWRAWLP